MSRVLQLFILLASMSAQQVQRAPSAESAHPSHPKGGEQQMTMGALAIASDKAGILFIDGTQGPKIVPEQVITLTLVAGQHLAELHDESGRKLWERIIVIPAKAQTVERNQ